MKIPPPFYEPELRDGYLVSVEMKRVWAMQLTLLVVFDGVCRRHGLAYFAGGGTLLGAVRHGGYIPWDDDIDLFMLREDYDRLLEVGGDFAAPFFLQTAYNDRGYSRGHAQLRLDGTTAMLEGERGRFIRAFLSTSSPSTESPMTPPRRPPSAGAWRGGTSGWPPRCAIPAAPTRPCSKPPSIISCPRFPIGGSSVAWNGSAGGIGIPRGWLCSASTRSPTVG